MQQVKQVRITALRQTCYPDLMERYELPQDAPCQIREGQRWIVRDCTLPEGMCASAWQTLEPFVRELLAGGRRFYGDWMRDPHSAMLSCNDGFRPFTFLLELV